MRLEKMAPTSGGMSDERGPSVISTIKPCMAFRSRLQGCELISEKKLCLQNCDSSFPLLPSSENNDSSH